MGLNTCGQPSAKRRSFYSKIYSHCLSVAHSENLQGKKFDVKINIFLHLVRFPNDQFELLHKRCTVSEHVDELAAPCYLPQGAEKSW